MSYSIAKTNYYITLGSFGNNQTDRNNINFGTYESTTEDTSSLPLSEILVGPQVIFSEPSVVVTVPPQTSTNTTRPFSTPRQGAASVLEQASDDLSNVISSVESTVTNAFSNVRPNRVREAVRQAAEAAEKATTNFGRGNR